MERPYRHPGRVLCAVGARCARHTEKERRARTPRVHEHTQQTRGADLKGSRAEPLERSNHVELHNSRRRKGTTTHTHPGAPVPPPTCRERRALTNRALQPPSQ